MPVQNLLNPCMCKTTGICKCCQPTREPRRPPSPSSGLQTPAHRDTAGHAMTESLIEMFKSKATTTSSPPESSASDSGSGPTASTHPDPWRKLWLDPSNSYLSPENMHHPAHTSPHVHKTKLYSPYTTSGQVTPKFGPRRESTSPLNSRPSGWASMSASPRPPPPKIRPLADMNTFLGAVFNEDGTVVSEIPRSALGLPGIQTFDEMAENGGVKIEPMELDTTLAFPTAEDVVIGACTCGDGCECPGCATHDVQSRIDQNGHQHEGACGESCKSNFDCADHLSLPSGITSIGHLLSLAAANVPHPARPKHGSDLNGHDTRVLPPALHVSDDAARTMGLVQLKPLECCNGRCQCAAGQCACEKECCGCCIRCACDEDGDARMSDDPAAGASCCVGGPSEVDARRPSLVMSTIGMNGPVIPPEHVNLAPYSSSQSSPHASGTTTPSTAPALRRSSSTSRSHLHPNGGHNAGGRRATTVTFATSRAASTGKAASKTLALHTAPHHPHPRPILPKPPSQGTTMANGSNLNVHSYNDAKHSEFLDHPSRTASPGSAAMGLNSNPLLQNLPNISNFNVPQEFADPQIGVPFDTFAVTGLDPTMDWSAQASGDDLMAYLNQLTADQQSLQLSTALSNGSDDEDAAPSVSNPQSSASSRNAPEDQSQAFYDFLAQSMGISDTPLANTVAGPSDYAGAASASESFEKRDANREYGESNPFNLFLGMNQGDIPSGPSQAAPPLGDSPPSAYSATSNTANPFGLGVPPELFTFIRKQKAERGGDPEFSEGASSRNLIDLSRPLNSGDVERILQALQQQHQRLAQPSLDQHPSESNGESFFDSFVKEPSVPRNGDTDISAAPEPALSDLQGLDLTPFNDPGSAGWEQLRVWALAAKGATGL